MKNRKIKPAAWSIFSLILLVLVVSVLAYSVYVPKLQELEDVKRQISLVKQQQAGLLNIQVPQKITATDKAAIAALVPVAFDQSRFLETVHQAESGSGVTIRSIAFTDSAQGGVQEKQTDVKQTQSKQNVLTARPGTLRVVGQYGQVRQFFEEFSKMSRLVSLTGWTFTADDQGPQPPLTLNVPTASAGESAVSDPVNQDPLPLDKTPIPSKNDSHKVLNQSNSRTGTLRTQQNGTNAPLEIQQTAPSQQTDSGNVYQTNVPPTNIVSTNVMLEIRFTIYDAPSAKDLLPTPAEIATYQPAEKTDPVVPR